MLSAAAPIFHHRHTSSSAEAFSGSPANPRHNLLSLPSFRQDLRIGVSTIEHRLFSGNLQGSGKPRPCRCGPLTSILAASAAEDVACFHFPGHRRGLAAPPSLSNLIGQSPFAHDLPELTHLDDLFSPTGAILEAQIKASELFGASQTWFLVGGSTCGIQASVMSTCSPGETIILPRNSHLSSFSAMVLSGAIPKYITPDYDSSWSIPTFVTALQVETAMSELAGEGRQPSAVLITSPTYHGICSEVGEISSICRSRGVPLIVDEAHGGHFSFHEDFPDSALLLGADMVVQSTHKVLSSLTQSSMLHVNGDLIDRERVSRCLQALQSSSPSYLLLASLDAARAQIGDNLPWIFNQAVELATEAKDNLSKIPGIEVLGYPKMDPLRVTVLVRKLGISGYKADEILEAEHRILSELVGPRSVTFAVNLGTRRDDIERLVKGISVLSDIFFKEKLEGEDGEKVALFEAGRTVLSPREAFFARKRKVEAGRSVGEVCGELVCTYPPGIPLLVPGEVITEEAMEFLQEAREMGAAISGAADRSLSSIVVCDF